MRIAIIDDFQGLAQKFIPWQEVPPDVEIVPFTDHVTDPDALVARLHEYDAVCRIRERTELPASILERLPRLKLLLATGRRNGESIDLEACERLGITVCETTALPTPAVELCWGLLLSLFRRVHSENASLRAGGWQVELGTSLHGKQLGILGLGRHGTKVAQIAQAFGMTTVAWSPHLTDERAAATGSRLVSKDALFSTSDAVTIHMPLSDRSRGIVGREELSLLRPHAFLINVSRGPLVDEPALIELLQRRHFAGYAADVFEQEPLALDHPFRSLPHVLATPHIGFVVPESFEIFFNETVENIRAFLSGKPLRVLSRDAPLG